MKARTFFAGVLVTLAMVVCSQCASGGATSGSPELVQRYLDLKAGADRQAGEAQLLFRDLRLVEKKAGLAAERSVALLPKGLPFPGYGAYLGPLNIQHRAAYLELKGKWWATQLTMDAYELKMIPRY
jgi:hypothetical protein